MLSHGIEGNDPKLLKCKIPHESFFFYNYLPPGGIGPYVPIWIFITYNHSKSVLNGSLWPLYHKAVFAEYMQDFAKTSRFCLHFFDRGCHKNEGHRSVYLKRTQNNERVLKEQSNKAIHKIQAMKSDMGGQHRHGNKWIFLVEKHCLQPRLMRTHV